MHVVYFNVQFLKGNKVLLVHDILKEDSILLMNTVFGAAERA